jgi:hypothetical protein
LLDGSQVAKVIVIFNTEWDVFVFAAEFVDSVNNICVLEQRFDGASVEIFLEVQKIFLTCFCDGKQILCAVGSGFCIWVLKLIFAQGRLFV